MRWPLIALAAVSLLLAGGLSPMLVLAQTPPDHYDTDGDGLIEISNLEQLNAIRWDLLGSGSSADPGYATAFPVTTGGSVCPAGTTCAGYELVADLDFDENGDGEITSADATYWNSGAGWDPIGGTYNATFEGNGHTITNLFIDRSSTNDVGLFSIVASQREVRNVGLVSVNVTGNERVGALAGENHGTLRASYAAGALTGNRYVGGLVGRNNGSVITSYTAMTVTGGRDMGGLVGRNYGAVLACYVSGMVRVDSANSVNGNGAIVGGLVGIMQGGSSLRASYSSALVENLVNPGSTAGLIGHINSGNVTVANAYYDSDVTDLPDGPYHPADANNATITNVSGKTTVELQAPTGYETPPDNIYANFILDVDGDTINDFVWDFGTSSRYPALKVDFNGDDTDTWQEFGFQVRESLNLTATLSSNETRATLRWRAPGRASQWRSPSLTYQVYRNGAAQGSPRTGTSYTDSGLTPGVEYRYWVAVLLNGVEARHSNLARVGGHDRDGDGLIEIHNLEQLNAIRWDLSGNGDPSSNDSDYFAAFPSGDGATSACPDWLDCNGYELMANLDFNSAASYANAGTNMAAWAEGAGSGMGWEPIASAGVFLFAATFDGNGNTISNLYINRGTTDEVGLFAKVETPSLSGNIRNVGLVGVNVTGQDKTGGLAGLNNGNITNSYVTGSVTGRDKVGILAGEVGGPPVISFSYTTGSVSGNDRVGGLVGNVESGSARVEVTYSTAAVTGTGGDVGGLLGRLHNGAPLSASYATGTVAGGSNTGGLVGLNNGKITASYSTGLVAGTSTTNHGGLVGHRFGGVIEHSHVDSETSGRTNVTGSSATGGTFNNSHARTTAQLQEPTGYTGDYDNWDNIDLDRNGTAETNDFWDFGTSSQYPALKADLNGDNTATWQEFGFQVREAPSFTETTTAPDLSEVELEWNAAVNHWRSQRPAPTVSYALYRDGTRIAPAEGRTLTRTDHTDDMTEAGQTHAYVVAALVDGVEARRGAAERVVFTRDTDGDGLIEITTVGQLNAIRYDLNGDGSADDPGDAAAFARGVQAPAGGLTCPAATGMKCTGYELDNDITLSGSWTPIGGDTPRTSDRPDFPGDNLYTATFEGNGNTISGLQVSRGSSHSVGLFGATGPGAVIKNVCLENVNVRGLQLVGALVGYNRGTVSGSCSTGQVSGNALVGGLVGWNRGTIERSYSEANVTGFNTSDASGSVWSVQLGGLVGGNYGTVRNTYATGRVTGVSHVAGLAGSVWNNGMVEFSYSVGAVSLDFEDWPFVGGLVGWVYGGMVERSLWNVETSGQDEGASQISLDGVFPENAGQTTTGLQGPTTNEGIYADWGAATWNFGTASDYPCLTDVGSSCSATAASPQAQGSPPPGQGSPQPAQRKRRGSVTVAATAPLTVAEGGGAAYTVVLDGQPTGDVTITASSDNGDVTLEPASLSFTPDNWQTPQTITVRAAHDDDATGDTAAVRHVVGGADEYAGIAVDFVAVAVSDDDLAGVKMWPEGSLSLTEGWTGSYQLSLHTRPASSVFIFAFSDNPDVVPYPDRLTFTPDNWQTVQLVGVRTAHDDDTADEAAVISHGIAAPFGSAYVGVVVPSIAVSITDDDTASVAVRRTSLNLPEGWTGFYQVSLRAQPTGNVVIAVSSDNGDVTPYPDQLTFTPDNWQTAQTVNVVVAHDDDTADDTAAISHAASGADEYDGIAVASVAVSITDDDEPVAPGVTVSAADPVRVAEGGTATYTVVLDARPAGSVTITASSGNADVTVQPASLTFTSDNWQTAQTVTLRAAHDGDTADDAATISHAVSGPDEYAGIAVASVAVSVTDDDEPTAQPAQQEEPGSVTVSATNLPIREGDDGATYTVSLDVEPTENVVVTVSSGNGDVTTQPSSLTFTPGNWQSAQTVSVSAGQDGDRTDDTATLSHSASGGNYDGVTVASVAVSVTDDDSDREILRDFYNATGGSGWSNQGNWLSDQPLNQWHGVTANGQGDVTHLSLRNNGLSGSLPFALGKLESLQVLSLDRNSISGGLPAELGNLSNLTRLAMNRNSLSGAIPSQLGNLSNLSIIGLARNSLSGSLPSSLGNLSGLTKVSLHDNTALSGALPSGFTNLANLQRLAIANTGLCLPDTEAFDDWLAGVPDKPGIDGLTDCASP